MVAKIYRSIHLYHAEVLDLVRMAYFYGNAPKFLITDDLFQRAKWKASSLNLNPKSAIIHSHFFYRAEFREAFRLFDKDGDGCITKEGNVVTPFLSQHFCEPSNWQFLMFSTELGSVMRSLGQFARVDELQEMLLEIDSDGDGNVSFEEFVEILSNMTDATAETSADQEERELRDAFRVFDKHNRGYITASDLRAVLQCLGEDLDEDESLF